MNVLYVDPGFTRTGYALFRDDEMLLCGLIETAKGDQPRKSDDAADRCRLIAARLAGIGCEHDVSRVVWEVPPGGAQCASALRALSWVTGVVAATIQLLGVEETRLTPREVKMAACRKPDASKEEIEAAVVAAFPECVKMLPKAKCKREHVCDALACRLAERKTCPTLL